MTNKKTTVMAVVAFVLLIFGILMQTMSDKLEKIEEEPVIDETISLVAVGDNLLHTKVIQSGKQEDGTYEFSHIFENLQPQIKKADLAAINQETIFGGDDLGFSGYPLFNSPTGMGRTLVKEGFDIVLHATNHTLDKGSKGVEHAIEFWKEFPKVSVIGINESQEAQDKVKIKKVKGAKIALLNYTYDTNGIPMPSGKEYLVNLIDEEKIEKDSLYAEEKADFTVCFMHWGEEYHLEASKEQTELAEKMCEWGVDLIIGTHPHVLQPVEWVMSENGNSALCYYSLGNFVSSQREAVNLLCGMADVKLHFDGEKVYISEHELVPLITHYDRGLNNFTVYRLKDYNDELAAKHGVSAFDGKVSVKRWQDMLDKILGTQDVTVAES